MTGLTTSTRPPCPMTDQCVHGRHYPSGAACMLRKRRDDGLFECNAFEQTEFIDTKDLPDPPEELFPDFDYKDKP